TDFRPISMDIFLHDTVVSCHAIGLRRSSAMPHLFIHVIYANSLSLYPFTERYAQPYFFSCLIRQGRYKDIVYLDDEEDVGVEDDFSNLETSITISPIPITRVHKYHSVTQIIGDLTSAPQARKEPKRVHQALKDPSWIEAMQEELLQFKMQKVWVLVDLPKGHTQEERIDYEEVFAPVARIEAIRLFLAYASFMGFMMSSIGELTFLLGLQVKQKDNGVFISQDKYVAKILRKFGLTDGKSASTPINTEKPLLKDPDGEDIVDFLTAHTIQYALMVNPTIYVSCIKQFWASVSIKKSNDVVQLQALIDRKKVIITEDTIRQALRLDDDDGKKFNFSKYNFDNMVRNVDSPSKFLMYLRFLQVMINAQVDDLSSHNTKYTSLALIQKVFANMRRIGKRFSGVETPLFDNMLVQQQVQDDAEVEEDEDGNDVPAAPSPPTYATISPPQQVPIPSPPQAQHAQPSSPLQ
nr:ribonuclease H-like domain-containing protein [Tanacetum cinerariifolium]